MNCSEGLFEEFQRVAEELVAGDEDRREDRLVTSTVVGVVAAPDFAVHDGGANRLFGEVIRGFEIRSAEEREELGGMAVEVFGEAFVLGVSAAEAGQHFQLRCEFIGQLAEVTAMWRHLRPAKSMTVCDHRRGVVRSVKSACPASFALIAGRLDAVHPHERGDIWP